MRPATAQRVPAHVRNLEGGIARLDGLHVAIDPAKAGVVRNYRTRSAISCIAQCRGTGIAPMRTAIIEGFHHSWNGIKPARAISKAQPPGSTFDRLA